MVGQMWARSMTRMMIDSVSSDCLDIFRHWTVLRHRIPEYHALPKNPYLVLYGCKAAVKLSTQPYWSSHPTLA